MNTRDRVMTRAGSLVAVVALHLLLLYGLATGLGVVDVPKSLQPMVAMLIDENTKPTTPAVKPPSPNVDTKQLDLAAPPPDPVDVTVDDMSSPSETAPATDTGAMLDSSAVTIRNRVDPVYPSASRRANEQGTVLLKILLGEDGRPRDVQVVQSSGFPRLDTAAINAVRKWRFAPAVKNGAALSGWVSLPVTFRLSDADR